MTKNDFLIALRQNLAPRLRREEVEDILRDQEEYISDAVATGRREEDVIAGLGDPKIFAQGLVTETRVHRAETSTSLKSQTQSMLSALGALLVLAPFNLIFVLGPFMAAAGLVVAGWAVAGSAIFASVAIFGAALFQGLPFELLSWEKVSVGFASLGTVGLGLLAVIAMYYVTRGFVMGTLAYIRWNLNFVIRN